jgi:hypothetical protein
MNSTKKISFSAIVAALAVLLLYIAAVVPSGKLALSAIAGIFVAAVLIECGWVSALCSFAAASVIALLLSPQRFPALMFLVFFGYYPLVKSIAEKRKSRVVEWIIKLAVFNIAALLLEVGLISGFLTGIELPPVSVYVIWLASNAVFVVYDFGFSALISYYLRAIHSKIK